MDTSRWVQVNVPSFPSAQRSPWIVCEGVKGRSLETHSLTQSNSVQYWLTITFPSHE